MSKIYCEGVKCSFCLEDSSCCNGVFQPLIDDSLCNTCDNAPYCYDTEMIVDACSFLLLMCRRRL